MLKNIKYGTIKRYFINQRRPKISLWTSSNIRKQDKEISVFTNVGYLNNIILTQFPEIILVSNQTCWFYFYFLPDMRTKSEHNLYRSCSKFFL